MRAPQEIREDLAKAADNPAKLQAEMLLDIRDILQGLVKELHDLRLAVQYLKRGS